MTDLTAHARRANGFDGVVASLAVAFALMAVTVAGLTHDAAMAFHALLFAGAGAATAIRLCERIVRRNDGVPGLNAPATAADIAQTAVDVVYRGDKLAPVASALTIARHARRRMTENLAIAVAYNAIAVPLAIAGVVTPLIATAAMSGSSVIVVANALRLARWGRTAIS